MQLDKLTESKYTQDYETHITPETGCPSAVGRRKPYKHSGEGSYGFALVLGLPCVAPASALAKSGKLYETIKCLP